MEKSKFIEMFETASPTLDMDRMRDIMKGCIRRNMGQNPDFRPGDLSIYTMEECAELIQAVSRRIRGRDKDNYGILEEAADVLIDIMSLVMIYDIPEEDIIKAVNVKLDREAERIREYDESINAQKTKDKDYFVIPTKIGKIRVTNEDIDDIMASAMTGCSYWCEQITVVSVFQNFVDTECQGLCTIELLSRGVSLKLWPFEDKPVVLTLDKFKDGLKLFFTKYLESECQDQIKAGLERRTDNGCVNPGMIDGIDADVIIQLSLFGEIIYS